MLVFKRGIKGSILEDLRDLGSERFLNRFLKEARLYKASNLPKSLSKYIGKTWDSVDGKRSVFRIDRSEDGSYWLVIKTEGQTGNVAYPMVRPDDLEKEIRWDKKKLDAYKRQKKDDDERQLKKKGELAKKKKERKNLDAYLNTIGSKAKRGRAEKILTKSVSIQKKFDSRYKHIERLIKSGYTIGKYHGKRTLEDEYGHFFLQKDLTKIALDYAVFLEVNNVRI